MASKITCHCGRTGLTLQNGTSLLKFQCGCEDCRQALQFAHSKGGIKPKPLPVLCYMVSDIVDVHGLSSMRSYKLRKSGVSRRICCTHCYSTLAVDHPAYNDNVFLMFPEHCETNCDVSASLSAYIGMADYDETIGPLPTENKPVFPSLRFTQEIERLMTVPGVAAAFAARETPPIGITVTDLIEQIGGEVLHLPKGESLL